MSNAKTTNPQVHDAIVTDDAIDWLNKAARALETAKKAPNEDGRQSCLRNALAFSQLAADRINRVIFDGPVPVGTKVLFRGKKSPNGPLYVTNDGRTFLARVRAVLDQAGDEYELAWLDGQSIDIRFHRSQLVVLGSES